MTRFVFAALCVLICQAGAKSYAGKSFNFYDEASGKWNQVWDVSKDGGKHFKTIFDGLYTRKR